MCDTIVIVRPDRVLFAKNSDRDANEGQLLEWHPAEEHPPGARLRCTWIEIPQADRSHATLISRPFWMWGAEMGANEHGVVIGNEAVFTNQPLRKTGLTGMDLVRLGLERGANAREALEVIVTLLAEHGQGGGCGHEKRGFSYHSSFLIADPTGAWVLETAGQLWTEEQVEGARTISNGLTIGDFARRHSDRVRSWASRCDIRRRLTSDRAVAADNVADLIALLRDHGNGTVVPDHDLLTGGLSAPCVHPGGLVVNSQTTASWVSELRRDGSAHWVTATAAPCTSIFKPVRVTEPLDLGPAPTDMSDPDSLWWRHERLHRSVTRNPQRLVPMIAETRDATESRWISEPPEPADAFAESDRLLDEWTGAVTEADVPDTRPGRLRRFWRVRNRRAGLG